MLFRSLLIATMLCFISCATAAKTLTFIAEDLPPYHFKISKAKPMVHLLK